MCCPSSDLLRKERAEARRQISTQVRRRSGSSLRTSRTRGLRLLNLLWTHLEVTQEPSPRSEGHNGPGLMVMMT